MGHVIALTSLILVRVVIFCEHIRIASDLLHKLVTAVLHSEINTV